MPVKFGELTNLDCFLLPADVGNTKHNDSLDAMNYGYCLAALNKFDIHYIPRKVIYNDPATIVYWLDGTKTVVKCQDGDVYDPEKGLLLCYMKKCLGNKGSFNKVLNKYLPSDEDETEESLSIDDMLDKALTNIKIFGHI